MQKQQVVEESHMNAATVFEVFWHVQSCSQQAVLCTTHSWAVLMLSTCKPAFAHTPNSWALSACMRPLCCSYRLQGKLKLLETHTTSMFPC